MVEKLPSMCGAHHVLSTDWVTQLMSCLSLLAVLLVFFVIAGACGMLVHADRCGYCCNIFQAVSRFLVAVGSSCRGCFSEFFQVI